MSCKRYVDVIARFYEDGRLVPLAIWWADGEKYEIDRVLDVRPAASLKPGVRECVTPAGFRGMKSIYGWKRTVGLSKPNKTWGEKMCGRYVLFADPDLKEIREIIEEVQRKNETFKTGEIFPTDQAPILIQKQNRVTPELVAWGFPHRYNKGVIINARVETVQERPMFRSCLPARRCVIPSTGFFEWSHDANKVKYRFNLPGSDVLYMAGLYGEYQGERRFVILTTAANFSMQDVHDRMPLVLDADGKSRWLEDTQGAMELLRRVPPELIKMPV